MGNQRQTVREGQKFKFEPQEFSQRPPHLARVGAIFVGQQGEAGRVELNQRVADVRDIGGVQRDFTRRSTAISITLRWPNTELPSSSS